VFGFGGVLRPNYKGLRRVASKPRRESLPLRRGEDYVRSNRGEEEAVARAIGVPLTCGAFTDGLHGRTSCRLCSGLKAFGCVYISDEVDQSIGVRKYIWYGLSFPLQFSPKVAVTLELVVGAGEEVVADGFDCDPTAVGAYRRGGSLDAEEVVVEWDVGGVPVACTSTRP